MPATARLDMRIDPRLKADLERAASLSGSRSLSEFISQAIREKADKVLQEHERIVLGNQVFDAFLDACLQDSAEPSKPLREAAQAHDEAGFS